MNTQLVANEFLIKQSAANLLRGMESVGGHLYLTNFRLLFESHSFNFQTGSTTIPLPNIVKLEKVWTKFLGLIPLAPNAIAVTINTGEVFNFTLWGGEQWIKDIQSQFR